MRPSAPSRTPPRGRPERPRSLAWTIGALALVGGAVGAAALVGPVLAWREGISTMPWVNIGLLAAGVGLTAASAVVGTDALCRGLYGLDSTVTLWTEHRKEASAGLFAVLLAAPIAFIVGSRAEYFAREAAERDARTQDVSGLVAEAAAGRASLFVFEATCTPMPPRSESCDSAFKAVLEAEYAFTWRANAAIMREPASMLPSVGGDDCIPLPDRARSEESGAEAPDDCPDPGTCSWSPFPAGENLCSVYQTLRESLNESMATYEALVRAERNGSPPESPSPARSKAAAAVYHSYRGVACVVEAVNRASRELTPNLAFSPPWPSGANPRVMAIADFQDCISASGSALSTLGPPRGPTR